MEELLNYLMAQRSERAEIQFKYIAAKKAFDEAKANLDAFGDMTAIEAEIEMLNKHIDTVAAQIGAVEDCEEEEGGVDEVVTEAEA